MPVEERERLAHALGGIADGADARDALGVRTTGRPRRLTLEPFGGGEPAFGDEVLYVRGQGNIIHEVQATGALDIALKGDTTQARLVWGFAGQLIAAGRKLPLFWNLFFSRALYAIANGRSANRELWLVRSRGNHSNPLRNSVLRHLVNDLEGNLAGAAAIAEGLKLTTRKGKPFRLSREQMQNIVAGPKVPE